MAAQLASVSSVLARPSRCSLFSEPSCPAVVPPGALEASRAITAAVMSAMNAVVLCCMIQRLICRSLATTAGIELAPSCISHGHPGAWLCPRSAKCHLQAIVVPDDRERETRFSIPEAPYSITLRCYCARITMT